MNLNLFRPFYANTITPYIPELWANESLAILEEEMVFGNLVHRDFNPIVASYGETVHTRRPSQFVANRKTNSDNVTVQDVSATDVLVKLDQWMHVSFTIKDGERTKAFKDLVQVYLLPAMQANARLLDQALAARAMGFLGNTTGGLGTINNTVVRDYIVNTREQLNATKAYMQGRNLVLANNSEAEALKTDLFTQAQQVGDGGRALKEGFLGRKFGFTTYMDLNVPSLAVGTAQLGTATTLGAAGLKGATTLTLAAASVVGQYYKIAGDNSPMRATNASTTATFQRGLRQAAANGAAVTRYSTGTVTAGQVSGWTGQIQVGGTGKPHVGQLISFVDTGGAGTIRTPEYVVCQAVDNGDGTFNILLDRNLETAIATNDVIGYGPDGDYNFAFHRDAIALVNRPLEAAMPGTGALAAVAVHNGMSMRVTITYDGKAQGHLITLDGLFGTALLDTNLGAVLLG